MTRRDRDPFAGATRLVIDGSNLLYALARRNERSEPRDDGPPLPAAALVGRIRAVVPAGVRVVLVFDGPPDRGLGTRRLTSGVDLRHSGGGSADRLILDLLADDPEGTLVVTDDGGLGRAAAVLGAGHARAAWLVARLARQRLSGPSVGARRPPPSGPPGGPGASDGDDDGERRWQPGRGATRKTGNPRRAARPRRPGGTPR